MSDHLKITLVQANLVWENSVQNRMNFESKINAVETTDIIVLPEMFNTGFSMTPMHLAEEMSGETVSWMKKMAVGKNAAVAGSVIIKEHDKFYNRFLFVEPSGTIHTYDKRHLFTLAGEDKAYSAGKEKLIISYKGWKMCPLVCYDLRFPVWTRNVEMYDVLLYVANWPKPRIEAWNTLLKARSIENMCYTIGVNRVGLDANGLEYSGSSKAFDYLGEEITTIPVNTEFTQTITLSKLNQDNTRKKFNFLNDKDHFTIH